jgi:hypothetical protein
MNALSGRIAANLVLLAALLACAMAQGQDASSADVGGDTAPASSAGLIHNGVGSCSQSTCHGAVTPWMTSPVPQNEYFTWRDSDPHSGAYRVLGGERARGIAAQLGLKDATQSPLCLGCHSDNVPVALRGPHYNVEDGIDCETCHGASQKWLGKHNLPDADPAAMPALGMYPTARLQDRVQLCSGCHEFGQHGANHKLVAAGHPVFPQDLAAYLDKWPHHYKLSDSYIARKHPAAPEVLDRAVSLRQASDWASALAQSTADPHRLMPEFSFFQCEVCHRSTQQPDPHSNALPRINDEVVQRVLHQGLIGGAQREAVEHSLGELENAVAQGRQPEYAAAAAALARELPAGGGQR